MGVSVDIGGYSFPVENYSITEDSTPLAAGDTSGGTGLLNLTILSPQPGMDYVQNTGMAWLNTFGRNVLQDKAVVFRDTRWGMIPGTVGSISQPAPGLITITAATDLNILNAYNITAEPYVGTLGGYIRYCVSLATDQVPEIDPALDFRPIAAMGWVGELWYHLKMLAVAHEFEIALVNGVLEFRLLRQRELVKGREISRSGDVPVPTLARTVEAYQYNIEPITNELVYPPGGWNAEVEVLNVNAGEEATYTLDLSASVSSIEQPVMLTNVLPGYGASSVYTVVANDGLVVPPALWAANGGELKVEINPGGTSLTITIRGAYGVPLATGRAATNFQVAMAADTSGSRYSTLRIVGTGVAFNKQKKTFRTGVPANKTATDVGVTIDNPFLSTKTQTYRAGIRAAVDYSGPVPSFNTEVTRAFRDGGGVTLGNVGGARVVDVASRRPFRVRTASIGPAQVSVQAEDDLLHDDVQAAHTGRTYADVQALRDGITYRDDYLMGLR